MPIFIANAEANRNRRSLRTVHVLSIASTAASWWLSGYSSGLRSAFFTPYLRPVYEVTHAG